MPITANQRRTYKVFFYFLLILSLTVQKRKIGLSCFFNVLICSHLTDMQGLCTCTHRNCGSNISDLYQRNRIECPFVCLWFVVCFFFFPVKYIA